MTSSGPDLGAEVTCDPSECEGQLPPGDPPERSFPLERGGARFKIVTPWSSGSLLPGEFPSTA